MNRTASKSKWASSDEDEDNETETEEKFVRPKIVDKPPVESEIPPPATASIQVTDEIKANCYSDSPIKDITVQDPSDKPVAIVETSANSATELIGVKRKRPHNPLFQGCRSVEEYQRLNFIDQGTYGVVFKARDKESGEIVALKQIKLGQQVNKVGFPITALREANILLALRHKNIVQVKEMVIGSSIDKIYMVMEYCGNDLKACMDIAKRPFSTAETKQIVLQLLRAMEHMHAQWFIHRDLKTSNILYGENGHVSICDFGMARKYSSPIEPYTHEVVTLWYRSPEVLLGSTTYSTPLDMWSLGCICAELLMGKPLFPGEGELDQVTKIFRLLGAPTEDKWPGVTKLPHHNKISYKTPTRGKLRELIPLQSFSGGPYLSEIGFEFLTQMIHMDPAQRLSASSSLAHDWLVRELPAPTALDTMPSFPSR